MALAWHSHSTAREREGERRSRSRLLLATTCTHIRSSLSLLSPLEQVGLLVYTLRYTLATCLLYIRSRSLHLQVFLLILRASSSSTASSSVYRTQGSAKEEEEEEEGEGEEAAVAILPLTRPAHSLLPDLLRLHMVSNDSYLRGCPHFTRAGETATVMSREKERVKRKRTATERERVI